MQKAGRARNRSNVLSALFLSSFTQIVTTIFYQIYAYKAIAFAQAVKYCHKRSKKCKNVHLVSLSTVKILIIIPRIIPTPIMNKNTIFAHKISMEILNFKVINLDR